MGSRFLSAMLLILILVLVAFALIPSRDSGASTSQDIPAGMGHPKPASDTGSSGEDLGVMRPDHKTRLEWMQDYSTAPKAKYDLRLAAFAYPTSFSLLDHIQYTPSERNQGSCGNCWAWAGTGVLETALDVQGVNKDRLSIQYLNSNYNGGTGSGFACCGGWLSSFVNFYSSQGRTIPWSNTNAAWADGSRACGGSTSVPAGTISVSPNYPITSITSSTITTQGVEQATAISNIKNTLLQNKAIWFAFYMATASDGDAFQSFWLTQGETAVWNPDPYSGHTWANGWGHAVLLVGYDDSNPSNRYWIILNSWGTAGDGRPNGLYRMKMDIDYNAYFFDPYPYAYYSLYFQTADVSFQSSTATTTVTSTSTVASTSYVYRTTTRTVTSYTSTSTSTSTIPTLTTVALVPLTVTSTVQSIQYLTSILTTTVTSYTSTTTSTRTIPTLTTVGLVPSTITSTVQSTQYLTSILTTTVTSYTATTSSTSTTVVYTTVTVSPGGAGAAASSPLAYLALLSLLAIPVGRVTVGKGRKILRIRSLMGRRCLRS